ncbi:MAG: LamG-like jellyroll fold domain-containing protein, partial [Candidatus Kariarchaeaceae archaeon]
IDRSGQILVYNESVFIRAREIKLNEWNHFKIEYTSSRFDLFLNGIKIGDSIFHTETLFDNWNFTIRTDFDWDDPDKYTVAHAYLDAIDFSWSTEYYPGRSFAWDYSLANITKYSDYDSFLIGTESYAATYGFEDEDIGTSGTDIDFIDSALIQSGCTLDIVGLIDDHQRNLHIYDDDISSHVEVRHDIVDKTSGTVEFWWRTSDVSDDCDVILNDGSTTAVYIEINNDKFKYWDGVGWGYASVTPQDDTWYHHKIVFDCTTDTYDWYIDGELEADDKDFKEIGVVAIDEMYIGTNGIGSSDVHTYIDAVGFSWDADYTIGDNLYDWMDTSISTDLRENIVELSTSAHIAQFDFNLALDGPDNSIVNISLSNVDGFTLTTNFITQSLQSPIQFDVTDTGNYEYAGIYYIQMNITINDTTIYYENIPFRIPVVKDLQFSQSSIIFEDSDLDGVYTSTHDFLGDTGEPDDWTTSGYIPTILSEMDGHTDVVKFNDIGDVSSFMSKVLGYRDSETLEMWIRKSSEDVTGGGQTNSLTSFIIRLSSTTEDALRIRIDHDNNGKVQAYYSGTWNDVYNEFRDDTWYQFRIEFNTDSDTYNLYINGLLVKDDIPFQSKVYNIYYLFLDTDGSNRNGIAYIDAIGFSWDSSYTLGDNKRQTDFGVDLASPKQLTKGDIVETSFLTNTMSEIGLTFLNNDVISATYTLLPRGNLFKGIQQRDIIINESFSFDEIEFSVFEDNYFELKRILILDADTIVGKSFIPITITNNGNFPEFVTFEISGVTSDHLVSSSSPETTVNVDRNGSEDWVDPTKAQSQNDDYASVDMENVGGGACTSSWHTESDVEQTITSPSYTEKHTLDFTVPELGDYLIIVSCEIASTSTRRSVGVRAQLDDSTTIMEALSEAVNTNRNYEYKCESSVYLAENLASGSHFVDIDALKESGTGYIRYARIVVLRLDDWMPTPGMYEYAANEGKVDLPGVEGQYVDLASISFTPDTAGDYLVLASVELRSGYNGDSVCGRINYDGASEYLPVNNDEESRQNYITYESKDTTDWHAFTWGGIINIPASSKTIKVQACRTGGTSTAADARKSRIIAIRLGAMSDDTQSTEDSSKTSTTNQWTDKSILQFTPSSQKDYFIIGGIVTKPDSYSYPSHSEFAHTAGTNPETISLANFDSKDSTNPADCFPVLGITIKQLNAESQTFKTRYGYSASSGTTYSKGSFILAIPLSGGAVGTTESDWIRCTNFGFDIPTGASIKGITVEVDKYATQGIENSIRDFSIRLRKASGQVGFDKKTTAWWDTIDDNLYDSYGGSSDLWETTWTAEDINNPGFGVDIAVENIGSTNTAYIDHIRIKVHYGRQMIEMIAPGETREMNFDIDLPDESLSNLLYRKIKYFESGTGKLYNCYVDNLEIDGIYIASPLNQTYTVIGNTITCGSDEIYLDIIPEEPLVWRAYSLNGAEDITFSGNIVGIPLPDKNGIYSIQVFGNNSIGTMFQSEIRYFTIKYPIEIIHPEESVSEKYHEISTDNEYSFNNDIPGSDPSGWTVIDHVDKGSIEVVENMNDQEKPVEIRNYGVDYEISMSTVFSDSYTDANITFSLLRESNNDKDTIIITLLCDDGSMVYTIENGD